MIPKETDESILLVMTSTLRELAARLDGEERRAAVAVIKDFIEQEANDRSSLVCGHDCWKIALSF